ncbi:MAG: divalent metal cation transporter [Candidatus Doudnabacteria bacterium]|nr:divalent metal cation transporter [Candidatus Doudnabacteria bacterium]
MILAQNQKLSCGERDAKVAAARKLGRALTAIGWLNAVGAGVATATGAGVVLAPIFGLGAFIAGVSSTAAGWLASDYAALQCISGGTQWNIPTRTILAYVDPKAYFQPLRRCSQRQYGA